MLKKLPNQYISLWQWLIIAIILFGYAIYNALALFTLPFVNTAESTVFSTGDNYIALVIQSLLLLTIFLYLRYIQFDWRSLPFRWEWRSLWQAVVIFVITSLLIDIVTGLYHGFLPLQWLHVFSNIRNALASIDLSLIIYSLFNGIYEELFFLGLCFAVKPSQRVYAVLFSLLIRCAFHLYQGLEYTLYIGIIMGIVYITLYRYWQSRNLLTFFIAHALSDIFGLSVLYYFSQ